MPYKVKLKLANDEVKELMIADDLTVSLKVDGAVSVTGLGLDTAQTTTLLSVVESLVTLFKKENWKSFEMEQE